MADRATVLPAISSAINTTTATAAISGLLLDIRNEELKGEKETDK